jgi:AcrR family transcriptional regulator
VGRPTGRIPVLGRTRRVPPERRIPELAEAVRPGVTGRASPTDFKGRQEIPAAIVDAAFERVEAAIDEATAGGGSAADQIRHLMRRYVEINCEHAEVRVVFQGLGGLEEQAAETARRRRRAIDHKLALLIEHGVREGELRSPSPLLAAHGILGAANWMHSWYRRGGRFQPEEIAAMLSDLALQGLAVERPRPAD